jgi:hypothetical protein
LAEEFEIYYCIVISVVSEFISKIRVEFYQVQEFFNNKIEALHGLAIDGHHLHFLIVNVKECNS